MKHFVLLKNLKSKIAPSSFAFWLCLVSQAATAQEVSDSIPANDQRDVYLRDRSKVRGKITYRGDGKLKIVTQKKDTLTLMEDRLLGMVPVNDKLEKIYQNLSAHKYFISPSSIPVKRGALYYSNQNLFFHGIHYGVSNKLTAGLTVVPFVQLYTIPKIRYCFNPEERLKFAINATYIHIYDYGLWSDGGRQQGFGYMQALVTSGTADNNFTIGVGKSVINSWTEVDYIISCAWQRRLSDWVSFITDNNLLTYSQKGSLYYMVSAGFRIHSKWHSFDFSILTFQHEANQNDRIIPIPLIGYNLQLNVRR